MKNTKPKFGGSLILVSSGVVVVRTSQSLFFSVVNISPEFHHAILQLLMDIAQDEGKRTHTSLGEGMKKDIYEIMRI